jgi:4-hydroxybutyrate CoA-transferase
MERISQDDLAYLIYPQSKIGIGNACAEPQSLVDSLIRNRNSFEDVEIYGMIQYWTDRFVKNKMWKHFSLNVFMVDRFTVIGMKEGYTRYIPCRYSGIPGLFINGDICLDAALISVSPPNSRGDCSFGVSCDFTKAMAKNCKTVIAEVNQQMPWVYGENFINVSEIQYALVTDRSLPQITSGEFNDIDLKIAQNASQLIEDEATIQIGIGKLSEGVLQQLHDRRRLGIHSGLLAEGVVDLINKGAVDNSRKGLKNGKTVTTTIIGTDRLFEFVHKNRSVESYPSSYTHNQVILSKLNRLHSINSALQVDLTGQVNAETVNEIQVSGVGGQTDFICGAALSKEGKSIILLSSVSRDGEKSKIVPFLDRGASVTSLRHDVDYVVSEYGVAYLRGKTLNERAKALISIAHPKFRGALERERRRFYP